MSISTGIRNDWQLAYEPLDGLKICMSPFMVGAKHAIGIKGTVFVSPAMHDLMRHANERELERLACSIRILWLDGNKP